MKTKKITKQACIAIAVAVALIVSSCGYAPKEIKSPIPAQEKFLHELQAIVPAAEIRMKQSYNNSSGSKIIDIYIDNDKAATDNKEQEKIKSQIDEYMLKVRQYAWHFDPEKYEKYSPEELTEQRIAELEEYFGTSDEEKNEVLEFMPFTYIQCYVDMDSKENYQEGIHTYRYYTVRPSRESDSEWN